MGEKYGSSTMGVRWGVVMSLVALFALWNFYVDFSSTQKDEELQRRLTSQIAKDIHETVIEETRALLKTELRDELRDELLGSLREELLGEMREEMLREFESRDAIAKKANPNPAATQLAPLATGIDSTNAAQIPNLHPEIGILPAQRVANLRSQHSPDTPIRPREVPAEDKVKVMEARVDVGGGARYGGNDNDPAHIGGWLLNDTASWEPKLWDWLIDIQNIESLVDVGCGSGLVTNYFLQKGVDVTCVEGSEEAIQNSFLPRERIQHHDWTLGPWFPRKVVDLAYSVEFMEHLDEQYLDNVMALFKSARYVIIAASKWGGFHHANVHFRWWWIERFEAYGFEYSEGLTEIVKKLTPLMRQGDKEQRGYAYLQYTGLVFRNPDVDYTSALKEPSDFLEREPMLNKHKALLDQCKCFLQD